METPQLDRFLTAQENSFEKAVAEIKMGRKRSHWMWYVFPQFKGLGFSKTSAFYAIKSLEEAMEYLNHPILGPRILQITNELLLLTENDAYIIFGNPDCFKLKSSMTLFSMVDASEERIFRKVLDKFFNGELDEKTLVLIKG